MPRTPISLALRPLPPGTKMVRLSPADRSGPLIVDAGTQRFFEMIRMTAFGPSRRPAIIILMDDADIPPPSAPNPETIAILREMFPDEPSQ